VSTETSPSRATVVLAFAAVYLIWGSTYLGIRFALETLPPFLMVGIRYLIAGGLLLGWVRLRSERRRGPSEGAASGGAGSEDAGSGNGLSFVSWRAAGIAGGLLLVGGNGGVVWAEHLGVPSGLAALIVSTVPLWVVVLEWLGPHSVRTGRPGRPVAVGVLLGLAGVVLLLGRSNLTDGMSLLGGAVVVGASLSWASGSLLSRRLALPSSPLLSTAMEMLAGGAMLTLIGLATGELGRVAWDQISARSLLAWAYLIVFGSLVGFTCYVWLLKVVPTSKVATYAYVNPVVALFLGWGLAGEALGARALVAAAVILGAVVLITTFRRAPAPAERITAAAERTPRSVPVRPAPPAVAKAGDCIWVEVPEALVPRVERLLEEECASPCGPALIRRTT
jgi:drug/metabolite transporter (DMT)-like permease